MYLSVSSQHRFLLINCILRSIGDEREGLRSRIRLQKQRIRDLETALQEAQLNLSTRPHSLLRLVPEKSSNVHPLTAPEGKVDRCTDGVDGLVNIDSSLLISGKIFEIGQRSSDEVKVSYTTFLLISLTQHPLQPSFAVSIQKKPETTTHFTTTMRESVKNVSSLIN